MLYLNDYSDDLEIDHVNCKRDDNRVDNLRCVTHEENMLNRNTACHRVIQRDELIGRRLVKYNDNVFYEFST